ncbi:hypothetical protein [Nocardia sp. NPDC057440]|uniref:hypothetical protein n=1 Tax=Nocardia sp. NPDC057440 TaxID=3346134 RepID=UPI0036723F8C
MRRTLRAPSKSIARRSELLMEPERNSPYWNAIVDDNWPEIPPSDWSALEQTARDGAAALDLFEMDQHRRAFDERVRSSAGLQVVKDDMLSQRAHPQAFADALEAAADTFRDFSDLVYRTRNQILDIVERATRRADAESRTADSTEDKEEADAAKARIPGIIAAAKAEVEDVTRTAMNSISPTGLPTLALIADALGMPGPWEPGQAGGSGGPGKHRPATDHSGKHDDHGPSAPHRPGEARPGPHGPSGPSGPYGPYGPLGPRPPLDDILGMPEHQPRDRPISDLDAGDQPADGSTADSPVTSPSNASTPHTTVPAGATAATPFAPSSGHEDNSSTAPNAPARSGPMGSSSEPAAVEHGPAEADTDVDAASGEPLAAGRARTPEEATSGTYPSGVPTAALAAAGLSMTEPDPALPMAMPMSGAPLGSSVTASAAPSGSTAQAAQPGVGSQAQVKPMAQSAESKAPSIVPKVSAGPASNTVAPVAKSQSATSSDRGGEPAEESGSNELIRNVVGAAMTSAAAPSFVLGDRVDGDLVLARTILSGVLAAVGSSVVGIGWAVSVMRHPSGISAFVTSNEGRGWLPPGLYLPREVSTPWVWEVAEGSGWEGVADPARVLAEFALAWGRKSGANLTALASSETIDVNMRRQLGDVPSAGEVGASSAMDLTTSGAGRVDRLALVGAPALLDRANATPAAEIGRRSIELATDAHVRVGQAGLGSTQSFGTSGLRERILIALRQGHEVPQDWWEELRDADDLLAATMLSHRADVSAVALGELRSEQTAGRSASDLTTLRGMVFERRCDEIVLLLEDAPSRQSLRDAIYAHAQIIGHPSFVAPTSPGPAPAVTAARRPTITAGPGR